MTLLRAVDLRKSFDGIDAVAGVSFDVAAGELVALIGPNGAGKTTCFNLLNGQIRPDAGQVLLNGADIAGRPPRAIARFGVGRGFQVAATFASMTAREAAQTALAAHHGAVWRFLRPARGQFRAEAEALLDRAGLAGLADRADGERTHGERKRLDLALALSNDPALLLMDEPAAGLTREEGRAVVRQLKSAARERGCAVLFTEHDMDIVFELADRVLAMDKGRLIATGAPAEVRADPVVRAVYLGEA
jgi:branched-chain amino acid transport system ATP-binding protein